MCDLNYHVLYKKYKSRNFALLFPQFKIIEIEQFDFPCPIRFYVNGMSSGIQGWMQGGGM